MFQLIGCLLAFFAIFAAFVGALLAGTVFALLTFVWVVVAKPRRDRPARDDSRWSAVYQAR